MSYIPNPVPTGACTPEQFGAKGDGLTNDTAAFVSMFASIAASATLGAGQRYAALGANRTYKINGGACNVPAQCSVVGCGDTTKVLLATDGYGFRPAGDDTHFERFEIVGDGASPNQIGIANQQVGGGAGFQRLRVIDMSFVSLAGAGVLTFQLPGPPPEYSAFLLNPRCDHCGIGLWFLGEYSTTIGMQIDNCVTGVEVEGGNQIFVGGSVTLCTTGVQVDGGGNDGHGVFSGVEINHNTHAIKTTGILANGYVFNGCEFYQGDITLTSTNGVRFSACQIDAPLVFDGSIGTIFQNCMFPSPQAYGGTITNNANGHASTTQFLNATDQSGAVPTFVVLNSDGSAIGSSISIAPRRGAAASGGGTFDVTLIPGTDIPSNGTLRLRASVLMIGGSPVTDSAVLPTEAAIKLAAGTASFPTAIGTSTNPSSVGATVTSATTAGFVGAGNPTAVFSIVGGNVRLRVTNLGAVNATVQVTFTAEYLFA